MNWKPDLMWCFLLTVGIAASGCSSGSVADVTADAVDTPSPLAANEGDQQTSDTTDATNITLVTLDLPGMT